MTDEEMMRYARQILLDSWDIEAQARLKNSHALIVGTGGLGSPLAQILTRSGIGRLSLVDFDVVDESNLQRQILFNDQDVGQSKVYAAKKALQNQNPFVEIDAFDAKLDLDNCQDLIVNLPSRPDLVIDCSDNFAIRDLLNQVCRRLNLPLLSTAAIAEVGQLALFTQETGCYRCLFGDDIGDESNCANSGVLASTVAVVGALGGQLALDYLGRGNNPIANRLLIWQGQTLNLKHLHFSQEPRCPVCQLA